MLTNRMLMMALVVALTASCGDRATDPAATPTAASTASSDYGKSTDAVKGLSSDEICKATAFQLEGSSELLSSERSTVRDALLWEQYRTFYDGFVPNDPPLSKFDPNDTVTICAFRSDDLAPPSHQEGKRPDTLIVSIAPNGSTNQEMIGELAAIRYPFPSDFIRTGFKPPQTTAPDLTADAIDVVASNGVAQKILLASFEGGFCFGLLEPSTCVETESLDGFGPVLAKEFPDNQVLVCFVDGAVVTLLIDLDNGETLTQDVKVRPAQISGRTIVVISLPPDAGVIGTRGFDSRGEQIP
jgi:hypothetical protein